MHVNRTPLLPSSNLHLSPGMHHIRIIPDHRDRVLQVGEVAWVT